jgi:hypothetical protein
MSYDVNRRQLESADESCRVLNDGAYRVFFVGARIVSISLPELVIGDGVKTRRNRHEI